MITFSDGSVLDGRGAFDDWCIYLTRPNIAKYAPRDVEYFSCLQQLGQQYGSDVVYKDFVAIYNATTNHLDKNVMLRIKRRSKKYGNDMLTCQIVFCLLYMGMVAEENKQNAILGKRIKHLGVYQILKEGMPAEEAANFSRGMKVYQLEPLCQERGF